MAQNKYKVIDEFKAKDKTVLVLDKPFEEFASIEVVIDGKKMPFVPNSVANWIIVDNVTGNIGKTVEFVA